MNVMNNIRKDIQELMQITKCFYASAETGMALLKVKNIQEINADCPIKLTDYTFPNERNQYLDDCAQAKINYWNQRLHLKDHEIPSLSPWYGIAEHSAFLGGVVDYGADTSWHHSCVTDLCDLSNLSTSEDSDIYEMVVGGIVYIKENYGHLFAPSVRGSSGVLEIANALCGNEFFYHFYEYPDQLKTLLEYCEKSLIWYYNKQLDAAGTFFDGTVTGFGEWLSGRPIGHISEDTTTMISQSIFEEFGKPYTQRIVDCFDGAFMHTHALSEPCLPSIADIKGVKIMEISSDPNTQRAIDVYRRIKDQITPIPV